MQKGYIMKETKAQLAWKNFKPRLYPGLSKSKDPYDKDLTNPDNWSDATFERAGRILKRLEAEGNAPA